MIEGGVAVRLRTAAWYGDNSLALDFPDAWEVDVHGPATPPPLAESELAFALEHPAGQPPLRELARGRRRPLIIVDDLTRPTRADLVLPHVLRQLADAGTKAGDVRILLGTGAHGPAPVEKVVRKVGPVAASACRLIAHDATRNNVRVGRTSFGTHVHVDREVAASDLVIGVGGVYPQHSVGFGGGSKLALGVLGRRTIVGLHYGHSSVVGTYDVNNDFRRDLDEIARLIRLRTVITLHVDGERAPVRAVSGDPSATYGEAVDFSRQRYRAPLPGEANVVVSNAFPMDVSLTFARSKGMAPLAHAAAGATRVLIAGCPEGLGYHALFPFLNGPRFERQRHQLRQLAVVGPGRLPAKLAHRGARAVASLGGRREAPSSSRARSAQAYAGDVRRVDSHPVALYAPQLPQNALPYRLPGMRLAGSWREVLERIRAEQMGQRRIRVAVYPCAPLLCLDLRNEIGGV